MTSHRTRRPRARRRVSARGRALLSLAAVAALASGLGVQGTFAFWTDAATVNTGSFTAGTLDITLAGNLVGTGGSYTNSNLALDQMLPGESVANAIPVKNNGTVGLTYVISGTATGTIAGNLTVSVYAAGAASNTGTAATGNRTGTCTGTALATNVTLTTASTAIVGAARTLATGVTESICLVVGFPSTAGNALQGASGSASILFDSKQVGS